MEIQNLDIVVERASIFAVNSLSKLLDHEVNLVFQDAKEITSPDSPSLSNKIESHFVKLPFSGEISGNSYLELQLIHENAYIKLLKEVGIISDDEEENRFEVLIEIGNIILNSCLGSIANEINKSVTFQIPQLVTGSQKDIINPDIDPIDGTYYYMLSKMCVGNYKLEFTITIFCQL